MGRETEPKQVIYVSGKYSANHPYEVKQNIRKAVAKGVELAREGYAPIIPHANTQGWEAIDPTLTWRDYMKVDLALVRASNTVYMLSGWEESRGARVEERLARLLGKPISYEDEGKRQP